MARHHRPLHCNRCHSCRRVRVGRGTRILCPIVHRRQRIHQHTPGWRTYLPRTLPPRCFAHWYTRVRIHRNCQNPGPNPHSPPGPDTPACRRGIHTRNHHPTACTSCPRHKCPHPPVRHSRCRGSRKSRGPASAPCIPIVPLVDMSALHRKCRSRCRPGRTSMPSPA